MAFRLVVEPGIQPVANAAEARGGWCVGCCLFATIADTEPLTLILPQAMLVSRKVECSMEYAPES